MVVLILVFKAPKELKLKGVKTAIFKSNIHRNFPGNIQFNFKNNTQ